MVLVDKSVPTQHFYPDNNNKVVYSYSICKKDETRRWNEMRLTINNLNSVEEPKTTYLTSRSSSLGHCYYFWHYKIFCVNVKYGIQLEFRIFYFIDLQNEENYESKESSSA